MREPTPRSPPGPLDEGGVACYRPRKNLIESRGMSMRMDTVMIQQVST